jgi:hypothetical protein
VNSQLVTIDSKDDRVEIWHLLHRLPPHERVAFLQWACKQVPQNGKGHLPVPSVWKMRATLDQARRCDRADRVLTNEIYCDLNQLFNTWGLDAVKTAVELTNLVRRLRV